MLYNIQSPLGRFGIELKSSGQLIGNISLRLDADEESCYVGYTVHRAYHGQGYATEATLALLDLARKLPVKQALAKVDERNLPSCRVVEKCGFKQLERQEHVPNLRGEDVTYLTYQYRLDDK